MQNYDLHSSRVKPQIVFVSAIGTEILKQMCLLRLATLGQGTAGEVCLPYMLS